MLHRQQNATEENARLHSFIFLSEKENSGFFLFVLSSLSSLFVLAALKLYCNLQKNKFRLLFCQCYLADNRELVDCSLLSKNPEHYFRGKASFLIEKNRTGLSYQRCIIPSYTFSILLPSSQKSFFPIHNAFLREKIENNYKSVQSTGCTSR